MAGAMSRNKGQRAERDVIKLLQPVVNEVYTAAGIEAPLLERNLMQWSRGGHDIVGLDWIALEVKHHEILSINVWWEQTKKQAGALKIPVLIYKQNRVKWRVVMFGYLPAGEQRVRCPVDISLETFLVYFKNMLAHQLKA